MSKPAIRTTDFDALASSAPMNSDAAKAYNMSGTSDIAYNVPAHVDHWDAPPKVKPAPLGKTDRSGKRRGDLTVVGYLGSGRRGARWLVKCLCGQYESRTSKAVDNPENNADCCLRCRKIRGTKRGYDQQRYKDLHGVWPDEKANSGGGNSA